MIIIDIVSSKWLDGNYECCSLLVERKQTKQVETTYNIQIGWSYTHVRCAYERIHSEPYIVAEWRRARAMIIEIVGNGSSTTWIWIENCNSRGEKSGKKLITRKKKCANTSCCFKHPTIRNGRNRNKNKTQKNGCNYSTINTHTWWWVCRLKITNRPTM